LAQIDPKRAIPREEQERTAKIFVGGVSPEASEADFKNFFMQFGRVIDATLMMDKDTGRPRGFGFVTFDGEEAVDRALSRPLEIYGKPMEVKRAQPRSTLQQQNEEKKFGRQNQQFGRQNENQGFDQQNAMQAAGMGGGPQNGISPAMMAKYWFNMQQYFKQMQSMMIQNTQGPMAMANPMAGGQMNPAMMQQMMGMAGPSGASPAQGGPPSGMMSPNMMQQMAQQQQSQQSPQPPQQQQSAGTPESSNNSVSNQGNAERGSSRMQGQQQQQQQQYGAQPSSYNQGGPTSWDGMYDDIPQPNIPPQGPAHQQQRGGGYGRGGYVPRGGRNTTPTQPANAPPNAPTGPKNAGRPGANYRGGGRGGNRGFHPYSR
jgi:RNA-binding protein Musashi